MEGLFQHGTPTSQTSMHHVFAGGCRDEQRPHVDKHCDPECNVPHSYCKDVNTCDCENGFQVGVKTRNQRVKKRSTFVSVLVSAFVKLRKV